MTTARTLEDRLRMIETCYEPDPDTTWLIATCRALATYARHKGGCDMEFRSYVRARRCVCGLSALLTGGAGGREEE